MPIPEKQIVVLVADDDPDDRMFIAEAARELCFAWNAVSGLWSMAGS